MRNRISITGIVLLLLAGVGFVFLFSSRATDNEIGKSDTTDSVSNKIPVGEEIVLRFDDARTSMDDFTEAERLEQVRDWLMLGLAEMHTKDIDELSNVIFDRPITREGYVSDVGNLEFGVLRSFVTAGQNVIALIPVFNENGDSIRNTERVDHLAHIADMQRKNLGQIPSQVIPFSYEINLKESYAILRADQPVGGNSFFSKESGYAEVKLTDKRALQDFLLQIQDITYVKKTEGMLLVGGRKRMASPYYGVTLTQVASLWQSMIKNREFKTKIEAFEQSWRYKTVATETERIAMQEQHDEEYLSLIGSFSEYGNYTGDSGFSLDPVYDYEGIYDYLLSEKNYLLRLIDNLGADITEEELDEAYESLLDEGPEIASGMKLVPLYQVIDKINDAGGGKSSNLAKGIEEVIQYFRFQKARYDGYLKGTEVGMNLFYTDLLAKLWTIDYLKQSPQGHLKNFVNAANCKWSPIFDQESKDLPAARLWFGYNNNGFQVTSEELLFARNATRIYAASNNPKEPGVEKPTAALFAIPLMWWNNYYEEVAEYEREYQRLNEIMKWSLIVGWLEDTYDNSLAFLEDVPVDRSIWFPDWVRKNKDLKFNKWNTIKFHTKGFKNYQEEVLPILYARTDNSVLSGGVSLAGKSTFDARPLLTNSVSPLLKRSNLVYREGLGREIETLGGIKYTLADVDNMHKIIHATPHKDAMLRSNSSQLRNDLLSIDIFKASDGMRVRSSFGGNAMNEFAIKQRSNNVISVSVHQNDVDAARSLARRMSASFKSEYSIMYNKENISCAIKTGPDQYLVKFEGSGRWAKISPETVPSREIEAGWLARVSDIEHGHVNYNLKFVKVETLFDELGTRNQLALKWSNGKTTLWETQLSLDAAAQKIDLTIDNNTITGWVYKKRSDIVLDPRSFPEQVKANYEHYQALLTPEHRRRIVDLAAAGGDVKYDISSSGRPDVLNKIKEGSYKEAVTLLKDESQNVAGDVLKYEQSSLDKIRQDIALRDLHTARTKVDELTSMLGTSEQAKTLSEKIEALQQMNRVNQQSREILLVRVEETADGFLASDGINFQRHYGVDQHASMLGDLKQIFPGRKNYYVAIEGRNGAKEDALFANMRNANAENPLNISRISKDPKVSEAFFESSFKVHGKPLLTELTPIVKTTDGFFTRTLTQIVRIRGKLSSIRLKIVARTAEMLESFELYFNKFKLSAGFGSDRLPDLVNKAKMEIIKKYKPVTEQDFRIEVEQELKGVLFVSVWSEGSLIAA